MEPQKVTFISIDCALNTRFKLEGFSFGHVTGRVNLLEIISISPI